MRSGWAFWLVVALMAAAVGYLVVFPQHWRRGVGAMSLAMLVAGVLRLVLPADMVGMLHVRGRWQDALCFLALGGVILGAAIRLH